MLARDQLEQLSFLEVELQQNIQLLGQLRATGDSHRATVASATRAESAAMREAAAEASLAEAQGQELDEVVAELNEELAEVGHLGEAVNSLQASLAAASGAESAAVREAGVEASHSRSQADELASIAAQCRGQQRDMRPRAPPPKPGS